VLKDGSLSMKFPWYRGVRGQLTIVGRRLGSTAPRLRADIPSGYGDIGFQALRKIISVDLLLPDDFAIDVVDAMETRDLYDILLERYRSGSIVVTSKRDVTIAVSTPRPKVRGSTTNAFSRIRRRRVCRRWTSRSLTKPPLRSHSVGSIA
jgi:hypothetical protein